MPQVLRVAAFDNEGFRSALTKQTEIFHRNFGDCKVEIDYIAPYGKLYRTMIGEGGVFSGEYDVFLCLTDWLPQLIINGGLAPLDALMAASPLEGWPDVWPESLLKLQKDRERRIYGLPYHNGPLILMYRRDLFEDEKEKKKFKEEYGEPLKVPETWSEFLGVARFFNRPEQGLYGTVIGAYPDGHMNVYDFLLHLWTRGGRLVDESTRPSFASPEGLEALQFYVDLVWKHKVVPEESLTLDCHGAGQFYLDGKAAVVWQWSGLGCMAELPEYSKVVGKSGYSLIPRGDGPRGVHKTVNVYWVLAIPTGSRRKEMAYQFLRAASSKLGDRYTALSGCIGTRKSTWYDEEIQSTWPFYAMMEKLHCSTSSPPQLPEFPQIGDVLNRMVDDAIKLRKGPARALREAQVEVCEILKLNRGIT